MNKNEFDQLRKLPGKTIIDDITFSLKRGSGADNLVFDPITVANSLDHEVLLNGTYKPSIPSVTFNFVLRGTGPICRVCVNGVIHKDVGRHHKHEFTAETDPAGNLPFAIARQDLKGKSVTEVWQILCKEANISHTGTFHAPDLEGNPQ